MDLHDNGGAATRDSKNFNMIKLKFFPLENDARHTRKILESQKFCKTICKI